MSNMKFVPGRDDYTGKVDGFILLGLHHIILAYRGQTRVEYTFRNWKNPFHCATRPQFHWTDQKIQVHVLTCSIGYLLAVAAYVKAKKAAYKGNLDNFLDDLRTIRLSSTIEKKREGHTGQLKVTYALEQMDAPLSTVAAAVGISTENLRISAKIFQQFLTAFPKRRGRLGNHKVAKNIESGTLMPWIFLKSSIENQIITPTQLP